MISIFGIGCSGPGGSSITGHSCLRIAIYEHWHFLFGKDWLFSLGSSWSFSTDPNTGFTAFYEASPLFTSRILSQWPFSLANCPICGKQTKGLGLTEEELEGYHKFRGEDADLEDDIPNLNAFERAFLIAGMCPDCQCRAFRKE